MARRTRPRSGAGCSSWPGAPSVAGRRRSPPRSAAGRPASTLPDRSGAPGCSCAAALGLETLRLLASHRPEALIVTNPPVIPGLIGLAWSRLTGSGSRWTAIREPLAPWMIVVRPHDPRPSVVGAPGRRLSRGGARLAGGGGVLGRPRNGPSRGALVDGGRAANRTIGSGCSTSAPCGDEPVETVCAAAALLQGCDVLVTGDPANAPTGCRVGPRQRLVRGVSRHGGLPSRGRAGRSRRRPDDGAGVGDANCV